MAASPAYPQATRADTFEQFARHVSRGKATAYRQLGFDAVMGRREGPFFYDAFEPERRYWNCHCNGGVYNLGHRNPRVVAAVTHALEHVDIGNHHMVSGHRSVLAAELAASTGGRLQGCVFGVAGGEAIDLAIKVARGHTGRSRVVSMSGGYHGHTGLALAAGDAQYRDPFGPNLPGFEQVPFDDVDAADRAIGDDTAAVLVEPVPATLGMPIASPGYLARVQQLCRDRGALFMVDEVQTGLARTGAMWCHQHDGLEPDVLITGKGLSGGVFPIAATLMTAEVFSFFDDRPFVHFSTFGGAELGCAAAREVLAIVGEPGFVDRVARQGERVAERFAGAPFELRRRGLMCGLRFGAPKAGMFAAKMLYDAGVFCAWANNDDAVLQFLPPLILDDAQLDELLDVVLGVFA